MYIYIIYMWTSEYIHLLLNAWFSCAFSFAFVLILHKSCNTHFAHPVANVVLWHFANKKVLTQLRVIAGTIEKVGANTEKEAYALWPAPLPCPVPCGFTIEPHNWKLYTPWTLLLGNGIGGVQSLAHWLVGDEFKIRLTEWLRLSVWLSGPGFESPIRIQFFFLMMIHRKDVHVF